MRLKESLSAITTWDVLDNCGKESFVKINFLKELKVTGIEA